MVVIRLARGGAKKRPFFNIVVADSRLRRDGRFIERVGFYNPVASGAEQPLRVAFDRVEHWTGHGAQMSPTVTRLVEQAKSRRPESARTARRRAMAREALAPWPDDALEVGRIGDAWGLKGGFQVLPYADPPEALLSAPRWHLKPPEGRAPPGRRRRAARDARDRQRARAAATASSPSSPGVADRTAAEALRGARIFIARSQLPEARRRRVLLGRPDRPGRSSTATAWRSAASSA